MILRQQLEPTDHQSVLDYYLTNYGEVHIITCSKCGTDLGIEIRGEVFNNNAGYKVNEAGFTVLPFGDNLLASRVRTDEYEPGKPMMGYQCGTPVANPEYAKAVAARQQEIADLVRDWKKDNKGVKSSEMPNFEPAVLPVTVPQIVRCGNDTRGSEIEEELSPTGSFLPHEVHVIKEKYRTSAYKPKFKQQGNVQLHETFKRERIK